MNNFQYILLTGVDIGGLVKKLRSGDMSGGSSGNWPSFLVDRLFEKSGAAQFMKPEQCDRSGDSYYPADNGWKSGRNSCYFGSQKNGTPGFICALAVFQSFLAYGGMDA